MHKIEKGIPAPIPKKRTIKTKELVAKMESGDSIFIPYDLDKYRAGEGNMTGLLTAIRKSGHKGVSRTINGKGWRVWKL